MYVKYFEWSLWGGKRSRKSRCYDVVVSKS